MAQEHLAGCERLRTASRPSRGGRYRPRPHRALFGRQLAMAGPRWFPAAIASPAPRDAAIP